MKISRSRLLQIIREELKHIVERPPEIESPGSFFAPHALATHLGGKDALSNIIPDKEEDSDEDHSGVDHHDEDDDADSDFDFDDTDEER